MEIIVTHGKGEGPTELSAFDKALYDAGIANCNIIGLSSIIPPDSKVDVRKIDWNQKDYGNRLYVVMSRCTETVKGRGAWSGLGWVQENETGKGLFVGHFGSSEEEVEELIKKSLESMRKYRKENYGDINMKIEGIKCTDKPACSIVAAVYETRGWKNV